MVTLYKNDNVKNTAEGRKTYCELRGLSTDTKPTQFNDMAIGNGSVFIETDTQKLFFYNETSQEWLGE